VAIPWGVISVSVVGIVIGVAGAVLMMTAIFKRARWLAKLQLRRWFGVRPPKFPPKRYYIEDSDGAAAHSDAAP